MGPCSGKIDTEEMAATDVTDESSFAVRLLKNQMQAWYKTRNDGI